MLQPRTLVCILRERVERLRATFDTVGAESFFVSNRMNVKYLTGFDSSNAFVLVKHKQVLVLRLISKYRTLGMFHADLDPLKRQEPAYIPDLDLRTYGFADTDLDTPFDVG